MYHVGICDDDKVFCAELEETINALAQKLNQKMETEVWYSGESIMRDLGRMSCPDVWDLERMPCPDILFLDIELYEKSGIDVGKFIRNGDDYVTHIVYVSSKQEYAMQLFRLQPLDFLIKPVSEEQIREVLERSLKQRAQGRALFEYQKGGVFYQIPCRDILYFMSSDKKVIIVTREDRENVNCDFANDDTGVQRLQNRCVGSACESVKFDRHEFYGKLKAAADKLPASFLMIHQSYIINSDYVAEYTYESVKMQNGDILNISKPYRKAVRSRIKELEKARLRI